MYRVGIIGTENSHALAFARQMNLPDPATGEKAYPDVQVVGVYGPDTASAEQIVQEAGVSFIANDPAEFLGKVDAMMITCRKGSLHAQYAMPFIRAGLPLFIDKPFTIDVAQAQELVEAAKKSGSKLCGGSGCKLAYDVLTLQNAARGLKAKGELLGGSINFAADPQSEYDGFFFYSPHLTEMALAIFGGDPQTLLAREVRGTRTVLLRYKDYDAALHYTRGSAASTGVLYGKNANVVRDIDISMIYGQEVKSFVHMLRTGEMHQTYEELVKPVRVISAIEEAVGNSTEVTI